MPEARFELALLSKMHLECTALDQLGHPGFCCYENVIYIQNNKIIVLKKNK